MSLDFSLFFTLYLNGYRSDSTLVLNPKPGLVLYTIMVPISIPSSH